MNNYAEVCMYYVLSPAITIYQFIFCSWFPGFSNNNWTVGVPSILFPLSLLFILNLNSEEYIEMEQKHHMTLVVSAPWDWRLTFLNIFRIVNKCFFKASSVSPQAHHHPTGSGSIHCMPCFYSLFLFSGLDSFYSGVLCLILNLHLFAVMFSKYCFAQLLGM